MDKKLEPPFLRECIRQSKSRPDFWARLLTKLESEVVAEIGVYRGDFSAEMLHRVNSIKTCPET